MSRFLEHLADAIRIQTVADDGDPTATHAALTEFRAFLSRIYPKVWDRFDTELVGGHSLLLTWQGSSQDLLPIVLVAHMDVVPVEGGSESRWSAPPFEATTTSNHMIGRGAIDDKGGLIAVLEGLEETIARGFSPRRTVIVALGHDEETMGSTGAAAIAQLLEARDVRAELVIDEGGFVTEGVVPITTGAVALVGVSEKGYLDLELTATGDPGHSSAPPKATAIGVLAKAIASLQAHPMPARLDVQAPFFAAASAAARVGARRILHDLPKLRGIASRILGQQPATDALIRTTIAPTVIRGGVKSNVLPASASAVINFRILPGDTVDSVIDHVREVVGEAIDITPLRGWDPPPMTDTNTTGYSTVSGLIEEVFPGTTVAPWVVIGATDARYYTSISECVVRFLPFRLNAEELSGFHGIDERIRLVDAAPAVMFYRVLVERMCG